MAGWNEWIGKKVFIISKNSKHPYSGKVIEVDSLTSSQLVWITIIDKYKKRVTFVHTEIVTIKEEEDDRIHL